MPLIEVAAHLQRHVSCKPLRAPARTLQEALNAVFAQAPGLRDYVVDDQGAVRRNVAVFVNGQLVHDRVRLDRALADTDRVFIAQALSGG